MHDITPNLTISKTARGIVRLQGSRALKHMYAIDWPGAVVLAPI